MKITELRVFNKHQKWFADRLFNDMLLTFNSLCKVQETIHCVLGLPLLYACDEVNKNRNWAN